MTRTIAALALSLLSSAAAACEEELRGWFDILKPAAAEIVGRATHNPDRKQAMLDLKMIHRDDESETAYATALLNRGTIVTNASLCSQPLERRQAVIAHELGHFMGMEIFPKYRARASQGQTAYTEDESYADQWGAKVLREVGIDSLKYLALLDDACQRGSQYFCRAAMNWRAGLTF